MRMELVITPALTQANVWFIFRPSGTEVRIEKVKRYDGWGIRESHKLKKEERKWLKENLLPTTHPKTYVLPEKLEKDISNMEEPVQVIRRIPQTF